MKSQTIILDAITTIVLFLLTIFVLLTMSGDFFNMSVHSLFLIIIFESIALMTFMKSPSLKMYYVFSYLFYGCIPYLEHSNRIFSYWGLPDVSSSLLVYVNLLIIFLNITVLLSYRFSSNKSLKATELAFSHPELLISLKLKYQNFKYNDKFFSLLLVTILSSFIILYLNNFNLLNLLFRDTNFDKTEINGSLSLVISTVVRPFPAVAIIFLLSYRPINYKLKILALLPLCLINVFPTGVPRFYAAAIYIPILILMFNSLLTKNKMNYLIIGSIFILFPILNSFRRLNDDFQPFSYNLDFLYEGHFDSYLSIGQVIQLNFLTYGRQLLGNILFFVPRVIWPDKPSGTGYSMVMQYNPYGFANVSANYYSEGYANFGYIGMFLFAIVLGALLRRLDNRFVNKITYNKGPDSILPIYFVTIGFLFFILRGDLLSSFSFFVGFIICIKICSIFFNKKSDLH